MGLHDPLTWLMQEQVSKLKKASGRTTRSSLTLVATALETNEWWKTILWTYLKEMPAVSEWSPRISSAMETLEKDGKSLESLDEMMNIVTDLGRMRLVLRASVLEELTDKVQARALQLCKACHERKMVCNIDFVEKLQGVVAELSIVFPEEDCYSLQISKLAEFHQELTGKMGRDVVMEYGQSLIDFMCQGEAAMEMVVEKCKTIIAKLDEMKVADVKKQLSQEEAASIKVVWTTMMEYLLNYSFLGKEPLMPEEQSAKVLELHRKWGPRMGLDEGAESSIQSVIQRMACVRSQWVLLEPKEGMSISEIMEQESFLENFAALQQENLKMESARQSLLECKDKEFARLWGNLEPLVEKAKTLATKIGQALLKESSGMLRKRCDELKQLAGGRPNGGLWSEGITGKTSIKEMVTLHEQGKLHTINPVELVTGMDPLQQAPLNVQQYRLERTKGDCCQG